MYIFQRQQVLKYTISNADSLNDFLHCFFQTELLTSAFAQTSLGKLITNISFL